MVLTIVIDLIIIRIVLFFLVLVLVSIKFVSSLNKATTFLSKKSSANFLALPIAILHQSAILSRYSDNISLLISILSGAKG